MREKISKYGVSSGPYFRVFGLNAAKYGPEKPLFGHFSSSTTIETLTRKLSDDTHKWDRAFKNGPSKKAVFHKFH